jgi:cytochrome c peroxidase
VNALDDSVSVIDTFRYEVVREIKLGGPAETSQLRWGEKLFHSAKITFGRQFSCRSCHPEGHDTGLTFDIEADGIGLNPVDNRTLRGILDTAPYKWSGTNPTLHRQCGPRLAVFFTRLAPFQPDELNAVVRYMCTIEQPPNRYRGSDGLTLAQRRGKAVFEREAANNGMPIPPEQRCAHCHSGAYRTNHLKFDVSTTMWFDAPIDVNLTDLSMTDEFGELGSYYFIDAGLPSKRFDVPHLRNVSDSAPFLHNGSAGTLEEIWTRFNMVDRHGMTRDLTRQQFNDLIAYLKCQ